MFQPLREVSYIAVWKCEAAVPDRFPQSALLRADWNAAARNSFKRDVDKFKDCMMAFVEARKAAYSANLTAANAAIAEYNDTMKKIAADQEAAKGP